MSGFSVNDHLEGILSDFEALKRSFDIDDEDDIPSAPPMPPPSSRTQEGRGATQPSASSGPHSPFLSQRGGLKARSVSSSLSFSHGNKPAFRRGGGGGGGGVARAASFQNRFHPNGYSSSLSGPGSDNDSLHSSSSSLEGPPASAAKYGGGEYQHLMVQGGAPGADGHRKSSSHGSVFLSEDALRGGAPELRGGAPELRGGADGQREGMPLGLGFANNNADWSGRPLYGSGAELHSGSAPQSRRLQQHGGPQPPRAREPPRLNKFPLDLENLTMNTTPKPPPFIGGAPGAARRLGEEPQGRAPNSVGSVLRRIASFSHGPPPDGSGGPAGGSPKPRRAPGGTRDGTRDGAPGGARDGAPGGTRDGARDGARDGTPGGARDGTRDGTPGGTRDGTPGGTRDGARDGTPGGTRDGTPGGTRDGARDGALSPAPLRREKDLEVLEQHLHIHRGGVFTSDPRGGRGVAAVCGHVNMRVREVSDWPLRVREVSDWPLRGDGGLDWPLRVTEVSDCPLRVTEVSDCPLRGDGGLDWPLRVTEVSDWPLRGDGGLDWPLRVTAVSDCPLRGDGGLDWPLRVTEVSDWPLRVTEVSDWPLCEDPE
ncbi:unnamed protein product [Boreogadus saida]